MASIYKIYFIFIIFYMYNLMFIFGVMITNFIFAPEILKFDLFLQSV